MMPVSPMPTPSAPVPASNHPGHLLDLWSHEPTVASNVVEWHLEPERAAQYASFPVDLHPSIKTFLQTKGISQLYSHQLEAWQSARSGENVVTVTGTASGKTLCYNLPVLDRTLRDPDTR